MNFASYEQQETYDAPDFYRSESSSARIGYPLASDSLKLLPDKFLVPARTDEIERPRLIEQTRKSLAQYAATIITGRAGTGKSVLAAQYAAQSDSEIVWYNVETTDGDWKIFASYLSGSLNQIETVEALEFDERQVAAQSEMLAAKYVEAAEKKPILLVLDDLHSVFDAEWFDEFFNNFVPSLAPHVRLLLIARTLPPLAVWRLRSKRVLGVVEEKNLTFTPAETFELFQNYNLAPQLARAAFQSAYGKISKIVQIIERKSAAQN